MNKNRLEAFSDGVFAIVITLLVLDIRLPEHSIQSVSTGIKELLPNILSFVFSFVVIGVYWVAHHSMLHYINKVDRSTLWLNIILLLTVSFIPFPASIIGQHPMDSTAIWLYSINLIAVNITGSIFWWFSTRNPELAVQNLDSSFRKKVLFIHTAPIGIYLLGALLSGINVYITYSLFVSVVILFMLPFKFIKN